MKDKLHIEELFQQQLEAAELNPSPKVWRGVQKQLRWKQFLRFDPSRLNVFYVGGLMVIGAGLITLLSDDPFSRGQVLVEKNQATELIENNLPDSQIPAPVTRETEDQSNRFSEQSAGNEDDTEGMSDLSDRLSSEDPNPGSREGQADARSVEGANDDIDPASVPATLVTYFTSSVQSGCAPLSVQFSNHTVNAEKSYWTFENGVKIEEKDPVYIFKEAGTFTVSLTAENELGQTSLYHQVIEVFPSPSAEFEIEKGLETIDGLQNLDLLNYSVGAFSYHWELFPHDQGTPGLSGLKSSERHWSSNEYQPVINIAEIGDGVKQVQLLATNEHGCIDSSVQELPPFTASVFRSLQFPSAFSPSTTGPGGGHFSPQEKRIDVFFPVFTTPPPEYRLRIYTRRGELVFETENIFIGWDGYYHQERSLGGVYVWMAEGKWANGEEFKLQGDVTLIWSDKR